MSSSSRIEGSVSEAVDLVVMEEVEGVDVEGLEEEEEEEISADSPPVRHGFFLPPLTTPVSNFRFSAMEEEEEDEEDEDFEDSTPFEASFTTASD